MLVPRLALGTLLLALPGLSRAQSAPTPAPTPAAKLYIGLAAYHSNFQNLGSWRQGDSGFRVPVQLTAGYQLRPRLALELSGTYSGRTSTYNYGYYVSFNGSSTAYYQYNTTSTARTTSVLALARYTLTRQPARRMQLDALGGLTLVHVASYYRGSETNDLSGTLQTRPFASRGSYNGLLLTAGLGLRYRLSSSLAVNFDITTNRNLNHPDTYNGFTGSAALGVRYRFGNQ